MLYIQTNDHKLPACHDKCDTRTYHNTVLLFQRLMYRTQTAKLTREFDIVLFPVYIACICRLLSLVNERADFALEGLYSQQPLLFLNVIDTPFPDPSAQE